MITGHNSDVEHDGRIYHVQTEDKGTANPIIETLIYCGGEILAARQSSYADLLKEGGDESAIAERIEAQHNQLIKDVHAGRYAEKRHRPFGEGIISNKSFDEVVLDYLRSLAVEYRIVLEVDGAEACFAGGDVSLDLRVLRPANGEGVKGAAVKVKMISTTEKPRILAQGMTSGEGRLKMTCDLPEITRGTAALIIQATAGKETAEVKRPLRKPARRASG